MVFRAAGCSSKGEQLLLQGSGSSSCSWLQEDVEQLLLQGSASSSRGRLGKPLFA
jgi:hypothetical protein